ncbi:MAG: membrane protein [Cyclobacteriaceae bacterium]|nr:MAG: membrane protein [Cyclobacteriaceae bacterium]
MFFFLSKTVPYLFMPLTLIILALFTSILLKNEKLKYRLRILALVSLVFFSNRFLVNQIMKFWEVSATPMEQLTTTKRVGIVLTGIIKKEKLPHDRVYFAEGADRVTHAIQLYKAGKIQKVIISGSTGSFSKSEIKEARQIEEVLLMCNVPQEDLIIEDQSRNTRESAVAVARIINDQLKGSKFLLITSAFHMRRSIGCFSKAGVEVEAFSTDFKTGDYPPRFTTYVVPDPGALNTWHVLFRELIGMAAYKFMGYI